ncbi:hypothetical protein Q9Q94_12860 [Uliginosibacterium sp. 31-16]|uniref:hypothetical protein n=1 Tax=Uliginosibacterium sp. 31-16 TaxID=3068315 RepID=UPI00273DEC0E|nr:hypothetical protein [Uliginosibacterium sp. 31-16]MDP5240426.1 hypothetical protein [Uliginosibacterium sp. 31-16]
MPSPSLKLLRLLLPATLLLAAAIAIACGFEFSNLLAERRVTLLAPVENNFYFDAAHLLPAPKQKLPGGSADAYNYSPDGTVDEPDISDAEKKGLSERQYALIGQMRAAEDGDAAYALGKGLPEDVRLYTAAAVDFHLAWSDAKCSEVGEDGKETPTECDDETPSHERQARKRFEAVLALPARERSLRGVWAAYALARNYDENSHTAPLDKADAAFALSRKLAFEGGSDPLGLALDSFGALARAHLKREDFTGAVALYAEQASHGSISATSSLRIVAERMLSKPKTLEKHIASPLVQRLLISYVQAYGNSGEAAALGVANASEAPLLLEGEAEKATTPQRKPSRLSLLVDALEKAGIRQPADADRLAAIAYQQGKFELAARFSSASKTPLASWIKAKLALRAGKQAEALALFAEALRSAREAGTALVPPNTLARLQAEHGTALLAQGDLQQAFEQFYSMDDRYWLETAYLAERVLTVDELKQFVDAKVPQTKLPEVKDPSGWSDLTDRAPHLRDLLARRLMRAGRYDEALAYFHQAEDKRFPDPEAREQARAFARALSAADRAWTRAGRAESLYEAAHIARWHGINIFGTEGDPDVFFMRGSTWSVTTAPKTSDLAGKDEVQRFAASAAQPDYSYHYRYRAAALAMQAADNLPPRSEAYAEVLNNACSWVRLLDAKESGKIYQRYLNNGAYLEWAAEFGQNEIEPGFHQARWFTLKQELRDFRRWTRQHKPLAMATLVSLVLAGAALIYLLRRRHLRRKASLPQP